jgi:hypothetical protein
VVQCLGEEPCAGSCGGDVLHRHLAGVGFPDLIAEGLEQIPRSVPLATSRPWRTGTVVPRPSG